jgi:methanogenic corrinoid protein MtbC1
MDVLIPQLEKSGRASLVHGKSALATVKGDIHSIGKDIVGTMLGISGVDLIDLGVDMQPIRIVEVAAESGADIIGLSALMTTSMPYQIALLQELGMRDKVFVIVGAGPSTASTHGVWEPTGGQGMLLARSASASGCYSPMRTGLLISL